MMLVSIMAAVFEFKKYFFLLLSNTSVALSWLPSKYNFFFFLPFWLIPFTT